jgi:hypothetical protein
MKYSPLLPQVALVFAVAYACSDAAAPANSRSLLAPNNPTGQFGEPPPPPVDVVISVEISSPGAAVFTGAYFTNGAITDDGNGTIPLFDGTAWLRFDNTQPDLGGTTSANARFMAKDLDFSGHGTLFIQEGTEVIAYKIVSVENFTRFATCAETDATATPCATIDFTAVVEGEVCDPETFVGCHSGHAQAFDKASCLVEDDGELFFICDDGGSIE